MPRPEAAPTVEKQGTGSLSMLSYEQLSRSAALMANGGGKVGESRSCGREQEEVEPHPPVALEDSEKLGTARARRVFLLLPPPHFWKTRETTHSSYMHSSNLIDLGSKRELKMVWHSQIPVTVQRKHKHALHTVDSIRKRQDIAEEGEERNKRNG